MAVTFDTDDGALSRLIGAIVACAIDESGVPSSLAHEAAAATLRNLGDISEPIDAIGRRRAHSYFWGVVRRRCLTSRGKDMAELRNRFITRTIKADALRADRAAVSLGSVCEGYSRIPCQVGETVPLPI